jgi:hypothetical protein
MRLSGQRFNALKEDANSRLCAGFGNAQAHRRRFFHRLAGTPA